MKRLLFLLVIPLLFSQCTKSENRQANDMGWIELNVSGAVNGEYSGMADFYKQSAGGITMWGISGHDYQPQTFSMNIGLMAMEEFDQPGPGEYAIGYEINSTKVFMGSFINESEMVSDSDGFHTLDTNGTLNLEKSNSKEVSGSFQFEAKNEEGAEIQVSGKFVAYPRQF